MPKFDCDRLQQELWDKGILVDRRTTIGICAAINTDKNMMFAGLPGTAKTMTAKAVAGTMFGGNEDNNFDDHFFRITAAPGIARQDFFGDWNYRKQFLEISRKCNADDTNPVCHDAIADTLYDEKYFDKGPALKAIKKEGGAILFIDEVNRGGDEFQNLVLEVAEEKQITVPMLGTVKSKTKGMPMTIVTYNEQDIGTDLLSDAFLRRFARIKFPALRLDDSVKVLHKKHGKDFIPQLQKIIAKVVK
jgi:MoxR-like ATPase